MAGARSWESDQGIASTWDLSRVWSPAWDGTTDCSDARFFASLALFFPSVTGIMAGSNRSGDLRNAQQSIPKGTIAAQLTTTTIYLLTTLYYGATATRAGLKGNYLLSAEVAWPHPIVVRVGIVLSTLGAGLQSLTGAPRLLQVLPRLRRTVRLSVQALLLLLDV